MAYGTHQVSDTLDAFLRSQNLTVAEFGEENVYRAIDEMLAAHNAIVAELRSELTMDTTERLAAGGAVATVVMQDADEYTTPDAQKVTAGALMGFPLNLVEAAVQWTRKYLQRARLSDINATATAIMTADVRRVSRDIRRSFFTAANYTITDKLIDRMSLPVKRLQNADSFPIPPDPWGNTFNAATHTHYLGTASFVAGDLTTLINTVVEHNVNANIRLYINAAQEAAIRAFTGFVGYVDARVVQANTATYANRAGGLDMTSTQDRAIGVFGSAEIWVKPWVPATFVVAHDTTVRPLWFRHREGGGDLQVVFEDEAYPLRAKGWEREFGVAVHDRLAMAVLDTANASYTSPTIT